MKKLRLFDWIKQRTQPLARYFRPPTSRSSFDRLGHEEMSLFMNDMSSSSENELDRETASEISPVPQFAPSAKAVSVFQVMKGLSSLILSKENMPRITTAAVLTGLGAGLNFLGPYLLGETLKLLASDDETITINGVEISRNTLITAALTIFTAAQFIPNFREQVLIPVNTRNTKKILADTTEHLLKKSLNYHVNTPSGDMIYLFQKGFSLSGIGMPILAQIAPMLLEISVECTVLSQQYGWPIGSGLAGLLVTYTAYSAATAKPILNAREDSLKKGNEAWEGFTNALSRYKTIHDFGKLNAAMEEVHASLSNWAQADIKATTLPLQISMGHILLPRVFTVLAGLYVASGIPSGKYNVEAFAVLITYLGQLSILLPEFGKAVNQFFASYPDLKFVLGELQTPDEILDSHPDVPLNISTLEPPTIEFKNVSFSYPAKPGEPAKVPLFQDLSFTIKAGEKVALVSKSGAGKTTIFNLIYRYYAPSSGTILINGQDISEVSLSSLQDTISLLGQTPNLFKGSVRANICYGAKDPDQISDTMIWNLAKAANLYDFLFALKLDTDVGENGKALSGGQQQKVAILRGLLKQCSIRMLDEITAPFDSKSATEVLQSINRASEGKTTLMITHKLTEAQYVDKIIVIDGGKVIAQGPHKTLLKECSLYQELWQAYTSQHNEDSTQQVSPVSSTLNILQSLGGNNSSSSKTSRVQESDPASYQFDLFASSSIKKSNEQNLQQSSLSSSS